MVKMKTQHGKTTFNVDSCPVCAQLCCCSNKSKACSNKHHCYRKCPVSRAKRTLMHRKGELLEVVLKDASKINKHFIDLDSNTDTSTDSETTSDKENILELFDYGSLCNDIEPNIHNSSLNAEACIFPTIAN